MNLTASKTIILSILLSVINCNSVLNAEIKGNRTLDIKKKSALINENCSASGFNHRNSEKAVRIEITRNYRVPSVISPTNSKIEAVDIYNNKVKRIIKPNVNTKKFALIIGNSDYLNGGSLKNPVNDAKAIATTLEILSFDIIKHENVSQKIMKKAIDDFGKKLKLNSVSLFFYAGHGVQIQGENYLIPVDANLSSENDVEYDCIKVSRVLAKMEEYGSKINIIILDACRDNPWERSWSRGVKGSGLAFMNAPSGTLIAYATSPGSTALDGRNENGLYTSALLKYLKTPNLTLLEVFQKVRKTVMNVSNNKQIPWESTSLTGNFYFLKE